MFIAMTSAATTTTTGSSMSKSPFFSMRLIKSG